MKYLNSYMLALPILLLISCGGKHGDASMPDSASAGDSVSVVGKQGSESKDLSSVKFT
ncbi:MAG: hypothetical protein K2J70_08040 [Muribaculaceae bacterium]|nr:hypothetical protein [Muribaculaceae bacterium]